MPLTDEEKAKIAAEIARRKANLKSEDEVFNTGTEKGKKTYAVYKKIEESLNDPAIKQALYDRTVAAVKDKDRKSVV